MVRERTEKLPHDCNAIKIRNLNRGWLAAGGKTPRQLPEPEQREPLVEGEAAGRSGRIEPEIPPQPLDLRSRELGSQTPPDRAAVAAEATPDEAAVVRGLESVHKGSSSAGEPERDGVDAGRGVEVGTAEAPRDLDPPPRLEQERGPRLVGTGTAGEPFGRFALDHEPGVPRGRIGFGEPPDDGGRPIERDVPQDLVGDVGQPKSQEVGPDDRDAVVTPEARAKRLGQRSVELHRDDFIASTREFSSEDAAARPDLDDQIASCEGSLSDQASRKRPAPEEVLREVRTPGCPLPGHDEPSRTWT